MRTMMTSTVITKTENMKDATIRKMTGTEGIPEKKEGMNKSNVSAERSESGRKKIKKLKKKFFLLIITRLKILNSTRFDLFNHFMKDRNTVIHINTNFTASVPPPEDRDNVIKIRDMCDMDNMDFHLSPAERENNGGFPGQK